LDKTVQDILTNGEFIRQARANLDQNAWDYLMGGSETETTLLRNRQSLDEIGFRPRVLRNVSKVDASAQLLDIPLRIPMFLAPMGSLQHFDPNSAVTPARAAATFGITSFLSSVCQPGIEETRAQSTGPLVFQLYVRGDTAWVLDYLDKATDLGYSAFCLTVDSAVYGRRERDKVKRFQPSARAIAEGFDYQTGLSWALVDTLRARSKLPLILKGIATAEDARMAIDHGIDVVYVSNHGGRQLDHGRGSIEVVPEVVEAVDGKAAVVVDGGFYRGTDVLKAIALGATAVGLGRLYAFGLAAYGEAGVVRVLEILEEEMLNAMALLGVTQLSELNPDYLHPVRLVRAPSLTSAFPLFPFETYHY
jgi:glycolate oxidase